MDELTFTDADDVEVFYRRWPTTDDTTGLVVIAHGASEHSLRYDRFAGVLNGAGYAVYALDHRGHGHTAPATGPGRPGPGGLAGALDDMHQLIGIAVGDVPGVPTVLFGHSMGSIFAQAYVERGDDRLDGYVLSGCPGPLAEGMAEMVGAIREAVDAGMGDEPLDMLGPFNEAFEPARTSYDWLSRDLDEVDRYIADPLCGDDMPLTQAYVADMLEVAVDAMSAEGVARTPRDLPVLLITGELDPVSAGGAQVRVLEAHLRDAGLDVTAHYYPGARHEVLNETNRHEVDADVLSWLASKI